MTLPIKNNYQKISRCLISVSDKSKIIEVARFLHENKVEIVSTGGTFDLLRKNNIPAQDISQFTGFPEIMDGRVKTLHPKVHGALLAVSDNQNHVKQSKENNIENIDLIIINLYPFIEAVKKSNDEEYIIENIDIGGPAMIRSASKNFLYKTVITNTDDYQELLDEMKKNSNSISYEFRKSMACKAFKNIADYDIAISNWFNKKNYQFLGTLKQNLRYGENSHQQAKLYSNSNFGIVNSNQIQGKDLSYNNFNDADCAYNLILEFDKPACAIIKHANPCGVAIDENILFAYQKALNSDTKSAFGGIVAINREINESLANEIIKMFYEVIVAPKINQSAIKILESKKNLRVIIADFQDKLQDQIKSLSGGFLVQDCDQKKFSVNDLRCVSKNFLTDKELSELVFSMTVCKHVKSNAIVVSKNFQTYGLGIGQTNRVDACEIACKRAKNFFDGNKKIDMAINSYLASDAFFPFADNVEIAYKYGIKGIVAPSGSIRDQEVINKANELGIALYFIKTRHFKH